MTLPPTDRATERAGDRTPDRPAAGRAAEATPHVWVMSRKAAGSGVVENIRAYDDETRARADLELVEAVSDDEFWLAAVPLLLVDSQADADLTSVQRLALTWLAQGAEAEITIPDEDPVVISPRHVRGFVSVPPDEWQRMEARGWVRDGMITAEGRAQLDR